MSNTRHYYYSDEWQVLEERLNATSTYDQRYVFGLRYIDDLILRDDGGTRHYCLSDYFSITALLSTSGTVIERYTYDAFGKPYYWTSGWSSRGSSSYSWETLYASYRYDLVSGMYQVRNRYLHPNLGRWISRDPFKEEEGMNLYTYVGNNSINYVDFMGLFRVRGCGANTKAIEDAWKEMCDRLENDCKFQQCLKDKARTHDLEVMKRRCRWGNAKVQCRPDTWGICPNVWGHAWAAAFPPNRGHIVVCDQQFSVPATSTNNKLSNVCLLMHEFAHVVTLNPFERPTSASREFQACCDPSSI